MRRLTLIVSAGCGLMTTNCAAPRQALLAAPRVEIPAEASRPCELFRLPVAATQADLEIGYATRGAQVMACDAARRLAVETHAAEHRLEDEARTEARRRR